MVGYVNKIIKSTFIDGPGSRLAIFFQGCNMRCLYCHNPETQKSCGQCVQCKMDCGNFSGDKISIMTVEEVFNIIKRYEDFIDGITVSGGECTLQHEFIYELFKKIKEETSLTTFIDTNGYMVPSIKNQKSQSVIEKLSQVTDGFMFDLKCFNEEKHKELTGLDNKVVMDNMKYASEKGLLYEVRTVVVEGYTDTEEEIRSIAEFIKSLNNYSFYKMIRFRPIGVKTNLKNKPTFDIDKFNKLCSAAASVLGDRVKRV